MNITKFRVQLGSDDDDEQEEDTELDESGEDEISENVPPPLVK